VSDIPGKVITLDRLESMFNNIRENTNWDMDGEMLWDYRFIHHEPSLLEAAAEQLQARGYNIVPIYMAEKKEPNDPDKYWLHINKIEKHTPKTLDQRNDEFYLFAHDMGLGSYDGINVGPLEQEQDS